MSEENVKVYKCECPNSICELKQNDTERGSTSTLVPRGTCVLGYIRQTKWVKV